KRYVEQYGIKKSDADLIVGDKKICDFFDEALAEYDNPKAIANYINGELMRRINLGEADMSCLKFTGREFAQLVELLQTDKLSQANTKAVLGEMLLNGGSPKAIADEKDLWIKEDNDLLAKVVDEIIANNPRPVEQYKNGDKKVFGFFMGQANKALKGAASPKAIQDYITKRLSEL
ncbi:MAG: Asp-tRNA(Asn)/Glu-tRNA(Gln) amidotransferase GatCAB subunit B, partial [Oscillospiraceae bacterium]